MKRVAILMLALAAMLLIQSCAKRETGWTTWRGPLDNGASLKMTWSTDNLKELWRADVGKGHSAVIERDGYCYTQGNATEIVDGDTVENEYTYCLDAATGRTVWRQGCPSIKGSWPGPGATPTLDGDGLYTISRVGRVSCYEAATGAVRWERDLVADSLAPVNGPGIYAGSPVIVDDLLFLHVNKWGMGLDKRTGEVIWNSERGTSEFSTPLLYRVQDKTSGILGMQRKLVALELATGKKLWEVNHNNPTASPILLGGDSLFVSDGAAALYRSISTQPEKVWEDRKLGGTFQTFVVHGGYAYGFTWIRRGEQPLICIDLAGGTEVWRHDLGEWGALGLSDGKLVIVTGDGRFVVAQASPEGYAELYRNEHALTMHDNTGLQPNQSNYCWTNPTFSDGKIFIKSNYGDITCFGVN